MGDWCMVLRWLIISVVVVDCMIPDTSCDDTTK